MPFISVIVTAHNRREYLRDAVDSVLNQTIDDYEIIVVKNFKDEIDDYLKENGVKSVLVGDQTQGMDVISGLKEARGEVISFLDDDDLFLPRKLEKVKEVFQDEEVGYYHNAFENFLERTPNNLEKIHIKKDYDYTIIDNQEKVKKFGFMFNTETEINSSSISIRRSLFNNSFSYLEKINHAVDVFMFYLALMSEKKIVVDPEVLTLYRIHSNNTWFYMNDDFENWLEHKKSYMEKEIEDYITMLNMIKSSSFEIFIKEYILDLKLRLARLPSPYNNSKYKATIKDYIKFSKKDKNIRSLLSNLTAFTPSFIRRKLVKKWYQDEISRAKNVSSINN
ncbi:glycosyltransferase family 2 protein [Acidianus brierleyi]|uniref:Glycosyltransferase 2-like domain-containing protein n=1 Tax=Acidianus brierleyi TaxID=41673 RepID=A0A2U9ID73_9CREN|nr:glycosyltransferase family 2 protein [Acidianus brierleyi]AWR93949.1 glycosyltransferase [Acidianus brierleyi]